MSRSGTSADASESDLCFPRDLVELSMEQNHRSEAAHAEADPDAA